MQPQNRENPGSTFPFTSHRPTGIAGVERSELRATDPADAFTQFLQDSINTTRKSEQKVRSLAATRARKEALWGKYVEDMKMTLQREHLRHQKEMERITADLQAAPLVQEDARAHLRRSWEAIAIAMESDDTTWDAMLASWQAEQQETVASHAVLTRALGAAVTQDGAATMQPLDEIFQTPPRKGTPVPPMSSPSVLAPNASTTPPGLPRTTDPYMTSTGQPSMPEAVQATDLGAGPSQEASPSATPPSRPRAGDNRAPIKKLPTGVHHSAAPPHTEIADKLDQKRSQHLANMQGTAMQPFRVSVTALPFSSGHNPPPLDRNLLAGCTNIDSEDDTLMPPTLRKPEGKME